MMSEFEGILFISMGVAVSLVLFYFGHRQLLHQFLIADLPFSKMNGVFVGLVSIRGTAESPEPAATPFTQTQCVMHSWSVSEEWERWETETYQDKDGHTRTREVLKHGSDTIASGGHRPPFFYLQDETGWVRIFPQKAEMESRTFLGIRTTKREKPELYASVEAAPVSGSTGIRFFSESGIALHDPLYAIGNALYDDRLGAVDIRDDANANTPFVISFETPDKTVEKRGCMYGLTTSCAVIIWLVFLIAFAENLPYGGLLILCGVPGIFLLCFLSWLYIRYYTIVDLKNKVLQAFSNVDVQLQRRASLIPGLIECVRAAASYEKEILKELAFLRSEIHPENMYEIHGCTPTVRLLAERFPGLSSERNFSALFSELQNTEQKIALARVYYNDVVTRWNTRIERYPESVIAQAAHLRRMELIQADDLERICPEIPFVL